ncbi:MAG: excalibur calcium-binding domain-containing protein [Gammaproteobacteria bacterium]|nr:excalibur calcium-binding domain-containing protein [Gammaproteobacteria bacterium]
MRTTAALLLWAVSALAYAQVAVDAYVTGAYDGDTIYVDADIWPNLIWSGSVRVFGIDTPEIQGACEQERARAILARDYVRALLNEKTVRLSHIMNDKYGTRVLADVHLYDANLMEWQSLAVNLMVAGHARAYGGGERQGWCGDDLPVLRETGDSVSNDPLELYDDDGNGRISCTEARTHGIAPVYVGHPAYPYMDDRNNDGVVCE